MITCRAAALIRTRLQQRRVLTGQQGLRPLIVPVGGRLVVSSGGPTLTAKPAVLELIQGHSRSSYTELETYSL